MSVRIRAMPFAHITMARHSGALATPLPCPCLVNVSFLLSNPAPVAFACILHEFVAMLWLFIAVGDLEAGVAGRGCGRGAADGLGEAA